MTVDDAEPRVIVVQPGRHNTRLDVDTLAVHLEMFLHYISYVRHLPPCVAERFSNTKQDAGDGYIYAYRHDPVDGSTPINTDKYQALTGTSVQQWDNFTEMVIACGTTADSNLEEDLNNTVFLIKQKEDNDHHLEEVPSEVKLLYRAD